ncbi:MAG: hypothetical protein A2289_20305 [Deltaproteobacteria bacterium RIFOXYA12_FULL_58_15]|nr:MAG: hypothetical protein A2289_20305 [Deltaproteobacteria bacterium RIFOXYA12_FULL_58_15]
MVEKETLQPVFSLPLVENPPFKKNLIKSAICELRFPILTSLRSQPAPDNFSTALRGPYPYYEQGFVIAPGQNEAELAHVFKTRDRHWTVSLRQAAVSLETDTYASFEDFEKKLGKLVEILLPLLDTSFFTRVGLRYVNVVPMHRGELTGWLNPKLHGLSMTPELGHLDRAWSELVGRTEIGRYNLRWGFPNERSHELILDTDFYAEDVDAENLMKVLPKLHDQSFALFRWCLDNKAITLMNGG